MKPYDLCVVTTTYLDAYDGCFNPYYRLGLFLDEIASMRHLDCGRLKVCWLIYDDGSPQFPAMPAMPFDTELHLLRNVGWVRNSVRACARACELSGWVLNLDSDGLIARDAIGRATSLIAQFPNAPAYGLFNTPYHHTLETHADHVLKQSIPEHGLLFRSQDYRTDMGDNFPLFARLKPNGSGYPVLRPSGIQHTGKVGVNSTEDDEDLEFKL